MNKNINRETIKEKKSLISLVDLIIKEHKNHQKEWFSCDDCSYKNSNKNDFKEHLLTIHEEECCGGSCEYCGNETSPKTDHKGHMINDIVQKQTQPKRKKVKRGGKRRKSDNLM